VIKGRDKGTVHFHVLGVLLAIGILYLLYLTLVKPRTYYSGERRSGDGEYYSVQTSKKRSDQAGAENMSVIDMEDMLESAVDIQLTAFRVKAEAVRTVWDSLDEKARTEVLTGFVRDIQSQQEQVNRLLEFYKSSRWVLLRRKTQTDRVEELLEYVGRRQRELTAFLEKAREGRHGGSVER
jgi:hypothetical protein